MNVSTPNEDGYIYEVIENANEVMTVAAFMAFGVACTSTLSYLNNVPMAKNCLLLFLYKDTILSIVWIRSIRMIEILLGYLNVRGTSKAIALTLSFGTWVGALYMGLTLILISIYKLCMAKAKMIDPKIPFHDEDEVSAIRKTRIACLLTAVGFLSTTFAMEWYPSTFYTMMPDQEPKSNLMLSNMLYRGTMLLLLTISCVFSIVEKCYNTTIEITIDRTIPKAIKYIAIQTVIVLACLSVAEAFSFAGFKNVWKIFQLIISLTLIIGPFALISRSDQLKSHSIRLFKNIYDDIFLLSIYIVPLCLFTLLIVCMFVLLE